MEELMFFLPCHVSTNICLVLRWWHRASARDDYKLDTSSALTGFAVEGKAELGSGKGIENKQTRQCFRSNTCYDTRLLLANTRHKQTTTELLKSLPLGIRLMRTETDRGGCTTLCALGWIQIMTILGTWRKACLYGMEGSKGNNLN